MFNVKFSALVALTLAAVAIAGPVHVARDLDEANVSWTIGAGAVEARVVPTADLVDSDNTSWKIGRTLPTPAAVAREAPDLVDSDNTSWHIGRTLPTPVARAVEEAVDSNNNGWSIGGRRALPTPVARAAEEAVDSNNTGWTIGGARALSTPEASSFPIHIFSQTKLIPSRPVLLVCADHEVNVDEDCCSAWTALPGAAEKRAEPTPLVSVIRISNVHL
ncbi:hypothetical protein B0H13DRAFT_2310403 [Mycena leptocephala]|nr:hypothetical protein B0H13DRAFT_2310403 [Mycena leptocephala]